MDSLPSNIMFDIFSRMPAKYLARSRCVSKVWCEYINDGYLTSVHDERVIEEPTPILYYTRASDDGSIVHSLCFHVIKPKDTGTPDHTYVLRPKKGSFMEVLQTKPISESSRVQIEVRGSCNGLMLLTQAESNVVTSFAVVHPLMKECYEVPPLPTRFNRRMLKWSCCGLGFDASTNTLKMVCVLFKDQPPPPPHGDLDKYKKYLCTLVHVLGTNSWREIPQVSPYCIKGEAVYANGFLHWFVSGIDIKTHYHSLRPVVWFDVEKEEFGLIDPPKRMCDLGTDYSCRYDQLVDLNGEVGYVCVGTMEVWLLNHKKEWVPHCRIKREIFTSGYVEILGCWNKDGDMLIKHPDYKERRCNFFVYNLKSGILHKTNNVVPDDACKANIFMHPNKLFSIRGIGKNSFPMKKNRFETNLPSLSYAYYVLEELKLLKAISDEATCEWFDYCASYISNCVLVASCHLIEFVDMTL